MSKKISRAELEAEYESLKTQRDGLLQEYERIIWERDGYVDLARVSWFFLAVFIVVDILKAILT